MLIVSTLEQQLAKLPHGAGFRFVTRLDALEQGVSGEGAWEVRGDEPFFGAHFPGEPIVPGVYIGEALAQLSGVVGAGAKDASDGQSAEGAGRPALLARMDVKFLEAVRPPAAIKLHSARSGEMGGLVLFDVRAEVEGRVVATGQITLAAREGGAR